MKIILTASVSKLGKVGDIVEVKNGYAKNFLIPNKKAICSNANNAKIFEAKKHEFEQANLENLTNANNVSEAISGKNIIIIQNASDDGRLYGSVSAAIIATKINEILKKKLVANTDIFLRKPIKEIGVYEVNLNLHSDAAFGVKVVVSRSESEVEALLKGDKKESKSEVETVETTDSESSSEKPKRAPRKKKEEAAE
jgi:large subunit ribosomal protein L9